MPFTDDRPLIEAVMNMSASHKIRGGRSKLLLREATRDFLPDTIYTRTDKVGFATPEQAWLLEHDAAFKAYITPDLDEYFDTRLLLKNWDRMVRNAPNSDTRKLWRMVNLGIWCKTVLNR